MPVINKFPSLEAMFDDIDKRLRVLERTKRNTVITARGINNLPGTSATNGFPQSGDIACDVTTGFFYIFMLDGNSVTTGALTYTTGSVSFPVQERQGFKPYQLCIVQASTGVYYAAQVSSSYVATSGVGLLTVSFLAPTYSGVAMSNPWSGGAYVTPPNPTTFSAGATIQAASWRQLVTASDLMARGGTLAAGTASGSNSSIGSNVGGLGEVLARGYKPIV